MHVESMLKILLIRHRFSKQPQKDTHNKETQALFLYSILPPLIKSQRSRSSRRVPVDAYFCQDSASHHVDKGGCAMAKTADAQSVRMIYLQKPAVFMLFSQPQIVA